MNGYIALLFQDGQGHRMVYKASLHEMTKFIAEIKSRTTYSIKGIHQMLDGDTLVIKDIDD